MEKLVPEISLNYLLKKGNDEEATRIISQVILDLQSSDTLHQTNYQHISEHISSFNFLRGHIDTNIIDSVESIFNELCADRSHDIILHGDLHHGNILLDGARGWLAIDPKGEAGELAYELAAALRQPLESPQIFLTPEQTDRRVRIYCERLGVERKRVLGWCFARNCSAALWYADHVPEAERIKFWPSATLSALKLLQDA